MRVEGETISITFDIVTLTPALSLKGRGSNRFHDRGKRQTWVSPPAEPAVYRRAIK
jgi:hypothetical protein